MKQTPAADTFEENLLFATLDPTTRKMQLPCGYTVLLTDTVGFIQDLPTSLVAAFRSTLEEVNEADFVLHVVDSSDANYVGHENTVRDLLHELEVEQIPSLTVYNKKDVQHPSFLPSPKGEYIVISAFEEQDLQGLRHAIEREMIGLMKPYQIAVPASDGRLLHALKTDSILQEILFEEEKHVYACKGYVFPNSPLNGQIQRYTAREGEEETDV